ncbi:MAG: hypothetical protein AB1576_07360 [Bacillota bacterium]
MRQAHEPGPGTFQRRLSAAKEKLTRAVVEGKAIRIEGGGCKYVARGFMCGGCGQRWEKDLHEREVAGCPCAAAARSGPSGAGEGDTARNGEGPALRVSWGTSWGCSYP